MKASEKLPVVESDEEYPGSKPLLLIVGMNQNEIDVLARWLENEGFETQRIYRPEEMTKSIRRKKAGAALIDITGFDQSIWKHASTLRDADIPFIVIAPQRSPTVQRDSIASGANGLLVKPVRAEELSQHIHTMLGD